VDRRAEPAIPGLARQDSQVHEIQFPQRINKIGGMSIQRLILGVAILSGLLEAKGRAADIAGGRPDDWLIHTIATRATVVHDEQKARIVMENGLVRRTFALAPNAATCGFDNLMSGQSILRGVKPEAVVEIDGKKFDVGGLLGQPDYAYLKPQWLSQMTGDPVAFAFASFEIGKTVERFAWKPRHGASGAWPPPGVSLTLKFTAPADQLALKGVGIAVHYEMYDGVPLLAKWITITNGTKKPIEINSFVSELLAVVEHDSSVDERSRFEPPDLCVVSDYTFHGMDPRTASQTTRWVPDPQYLTQVNYERKTPCLLESTPPIGPDVILAPGKSFDSFRTFELVFDSTDRERNGLAAGGCSGCWRPGARRIRS
jgi:hypothetical protein